MIYMIRGCAQLSFEPAEYVYIDTDAPFSTLKSNCLCLYMLINHTDSILSQCYKLGCQNTL